MIRSLVVFCIVMNIDSINDTEAPLLAARQVYDERRWMASY